MAGVSWAVRASTATARARHAAVLPVGAVGAWGWWGFASKGGEEAAAEGGAARMVGAVKEEGRVDMSVIRDIVADPNPAKHRPGDAGKVFQLDKKELKQLFPNGIAGAFHLLFYGTRSALPQKYRRIDDWWNVTLKETPGMIIRKEASHIMSALHCIARTNSKKGGEPTVNTPGFLIDGPPGSGKSTVLNHIAHWAVKTGEWIVIWVPHASDLVSNKGQHPPPIPFLPILALSPLSHLLSCPHLACAPLLLSPLPSTPFPSFLTSPNPQLMEPEPCICQAISQGAGTTGSTSPSLSTLSNT